MTTDQNDQQSTHALSKEFISFSLSRAIKQSGAIKGVEQGLGRVVCSRLIFRGETVYALIYLDKEAGPFTIIPRSGIEFRHLKSVGVAEKNYDAMGFDGFMTTMEFEDILKLENEARLAGVFGFE